MSPLCSLWSIVLQQTLSFESSLKKGYVKKNSFFFKSGLTYLGHKFHSNISVQLMNDVSIQIPTWINVTK